MSAEKKQKATDKEPVQNNASDAIVPVSTTGTKTTTDSSRKRKFRQLPLKFVRWRDITFPNPCIVFTACECRMVKNKERAERHANYIHIVSIGPCAGMSCKKVLLQGTLLTQKKVKVLGGVLTEDTPKEVLFNESSMGSVLAGTGLPVIGKKTIVNGHDTISRQKMMTRLYTERERDL